MKRSILYVFLIFLILALSSACSSESGTVAITFDPNGAVAFEKITINVSEGARIPVSMIPTFNYDGKEFKGLYTNAECTESNVWTNDMAITKDMTLYAKWADISYTVSFNANSGTGTMNDASGICGTYALPESSFTAPSGKFFAGWALSADGDTIVGSSISVSADTTLYGKWSNNDFARFIKTTLDAADVTAIVFETGKTQDPSYITINDGIWGIKDGTTVKIQTSGTSIDLQNYAS